MAEKKVAIIGGASSRRRAPYNDESWDIWAFSSLRVKTPRITRWFELHALEDLQEQLQTKTSRKKSYTEYMRFLKELDGPIYMQQKNEFLPTSVAYPLEEAVNAFGRCFTSSASYLLALAILERYDTIGVWGIHLTASGVYRAQRRGVEYLLGVAKQQGINIYLPRGCPLQIPTRPRPVVTDILYGYDWQSPKAWWRRKPPTRKRKSRRKSIR